MLGITSDIVESDKREFIIQFIINSSTTGVRENITIQIIQIFSYDIINLHYLQQVIILI